MNDAPKWLVIFAFIGLCGWFGYRGLLYFTHVSTPQMTIDGIESNTSYAGLCDVHIRGASPYGLRTLSVSLDDQPISNSPFKLSGTQCDQAVAIDCGALVHGAHVLCAELVDASYHAGTKQMIVPFFVDREPLVITPLADSYTVQLGKTIHATYTSNKKLAWARATFDGRECVCCPDSDGSLIYECFMPTDCEDQAGRLPLKIVCADSAGNTVSIDIPVETTPFEIKRGVFRSTNLGEKLAQEKEVSANTKLLDDALVRCAHESPHHKLWRGGFVAPCEVQQISTIYGALRVSAEKGRYIHKAVDILDAPRSVVWAAQSGRVVVKDRFLFPGNVVVIDHGLGIMTMYSHLEDFADIAVGDMVKKGQPIGRVGKTGYANGYHLHWELRINNIPVDPMQWLESGF